MFRRKTLENLKGNARLPRGPVREAFRQLLKNKAGVVGGVFIICLVIISFCPDSLIISKIFGVEIKQWIAPYPYGKVSFRNRDLPPGKPWLPSWL